MAQGNKGRTQQQSKAVLAAAHDSGRQTREWTSPTKPSTRRGRSKGGEGIGRGSRKVTKPDAAGEQKVQTCMQALLEFLGMVPELTEAMQEDAPGSVLAGCERDCKHLAFKALTFLQQVDSTNCQFVVNSILGFNVFCQP